MRTYVQMVGSRHPDFADLARDWHLRTAGELASDDLVQAYRLESFVNTGSQIRAGAGESCTLQGEEEEEEEEGVT